MQQQHWICLRWRVNHHLILNYAVELLPINKTTTTSWLLVVVLGLAIIALANPVLGAFPKTAHSVAPGYGAPVYAFEMARSPFIAWLGIPVWTKFLSIMTCIIAAGIFLMSQKNVLWRVLGVCSLLGGGTIFGAFLSPERFTYLIGGATTVGWIAMLLFGGYHSFRHSFRNLEQP